MCIRDRSVLHDVSLEVAPGGVGEVAPFEVSENDWPTYRANNHRSASTPAQLARPRPQPGQTPPDRPDFSHRPSLELPKLPPRDG